MSVKIRMARVGAKKRPFYHIVVASSRSPRDGRYLEAIGSYNPMVAKDHADRFKIDQERAKYWLGVGALPSDRVARLMSGLGLVAAPAVPTQTKKSAPRPKTVERLKVAADAAAAKAEAAAKAAAEPPAAPAEGEAAAG